MIRLPPVKKMVQSVNGNSLDGLKNRNGRGRKSLLSKEKKQRIKKVVLKELPSDHGYNANKWIGPLLAKWIESKYGIKYQRAQIYNLLRSLGIEFYKEKGFVKNGV